MCHLWNVAIGSVLIASLVFPLTATTQTSTLTPAAPEKRYALFDASTVRRLPDHKGNIPGLRRSWPRDVVLPDGTKIVVYQVSLIDRRSVPPPPFRPGDILYAVDGILFKSIDGLPRYLQSLTPGSMATVEYLSPPPHVRSSEPPRNAAAHYAKLMARSSAPQNLVPSLVTVQIIFQPATYTCRRCPADPPKTTPAEELKAMAPYMLAGAASGTLIQAIFDTLKLGPDRMFELMMRKGHPNAEED
jgi:hypothetical protein